MRRFTRGLTLIELLVVVTIVSILAPMVFPVFARACESARKARCLSNVKNIALAISMYLSDNDGTLPPWETRREVLDYVATAPGGGDGCEPGESTGRDSVRENAARFNPYLRWQVVLDEYVRNRGVWRCPSAKMCMKAGWVVPVPDFLRWFQANEGSWGEAADGDGPCLFSWPIGWGGRVTDSILQGSAFDDSKSFEYSIGVSRGQAGVKLAAISDPARLVICGEQGSPDTLDGIGRLAYPDICCAECADISWRAWGWPSEDCPNGDYCPECPPTHATYLQLHEGSSDGWRRDGSRHLGGVNVGFLDGHARWFSSRRLLGMYEDGDILGIHQFCWVSDLEHYQQECGDPSGIEFLLSRGQGEYR